MDALTILAITQDSDSNRRSIFDPESSKTWQHFQTGVVSFVVRSYLSFESHWNRLISGGSFVEFGSFVLSGIILTFGFFLVPFVVAVGGLMTLLSAISGAMSAGRRVDREAEDSVDIRLIQGAQWIDQMQKWLDDKYQQQEKIQDSYRCCSMRREGIIRCFPLLSDGDNRQPSPCPSNIFRDVHVQQRTK